MKVIARVKLKIYAKKASSLPPIGPALGQKGINIVKFCRDFNEKTKHYESKIKLSVLILVHSDKSYNFFISQPSIVDWIKKLKNIEKGAINPGREICCTLSKSNVIEIAKKKMIDMKISKLSSAVKMVEGTSYSMGVYILK